MVLLGQAGPGTGDLAVIALLLVAMILPVVIVLGVALYLTRDEWTGDRNDHVDKELSEDLSTLGSSETDDCPAESDGPRDGE
ncbi:hypothetical protein [Haloarcula montana]|uniref:hypothetical protein n=1 Tax=Haloarcula montana TaxID=3111776 RepID=UPI002D767C77|nr:hypothetical protein [Haloarcula sp. GH36]